MKGCTGWLYLRVMARHVSYLIDRVRVRKKGRSRCWQGVRKIYGTREACELRICQPYQNDCGVWAEKSTIGLASSTFDLESSNGKAFYILSMITISH